MTLPECVSLSRGIEGGVGKFLQENALPALDFPAAADKLLSCRPLHNTHNLNQ